MSVDSQLIGMGWKDIRVSETLRESLRQVETAVATIMKDANVRVGNKAWATSPEGCKIQSLIKISITLKEAIKELEENDL